MRISVKLGYFALGLPLSAAAVAGLGVARLTHQFPAAAASPGLLTPFLLPVLALALEAGALIALSVAQLSVLTRAPASQVAARARATWLFLGLLALVLGLAEAIPRGTERPGAFANELVRSARSSCGSGSVAVPLLGLSVRCAAPQRIEGPMPGSRKVRLAMEELTFSDDLRRVDIRALELFAESSLRVRLRAKDARVRGLAPWSRSPRLSALGRFAILAALGVVLWLGASLLLRPRTAERRVAPERVWRAVGYSLFAVPGAVVAAVVISLDQAEAAPLTYAWAGLLGAVALGVVALLLARIPQIAGSFPDP
ncbi:MAG TPA: hypothetical protein VEQ59_25030 [Polyangiaceae bacterium]|nr:hypothetical protein [Polyangiaceae bacterium]